MSDDTGLRTRARALLLGGKLPRTRPECTWGGPGEGARCAVCEAPVRREELEVEVEFAGHAGDLRRFHVPCFAAWELACRELECPEPTSPAQHGEVCRQ